jgi:hypothetical protein
MQMDHFFTFGQSDNFSSCVHFQALSLHLLHLSKFVHHITRFSDVVKNVIHAKLRKICDVWTPARGAL